MEYIDPQHQPERRSIWEPEYEAPKPVVDEWGQPIDPYAPKIELPDKGDDGKPLWHRLNNLPDIKPSPEGKEKDPNAPEPLWGNKPPETEPNAKTNPAPTEREQPLGPLWGTPPTEPVVIASTPMVSVGDMNIPADADLREFMTRVVKHRGLKLATKAVALSAGDTVLPVGELISAGLTVYEVYAIYNDWQTFQRRRDQALHPTPAETPSISSPAAPNAKDAGIAEAGPDLSREQPILNPITGEDPVSQPLSRDINQLDRQLEAKHKAEIREAKSAERRIALREPAREFYNDQIYHPRHKDNLTLYENWLLRNDTQWLDTLGSRTERQFKTLTDGGKDFTRPDLLRLSETPEQVKRQMLAHNLYKSDLRARELLDYSMLGVNIDSITDGNKSFNLKELLRVRSHFDAAFAGEYGMLNPKVAIIVSSKADELYRRETGAKVADREDPLWKSLRNIELIKYDRNIWGTVLTDPPPGEVMKTVVEQPRDPKDNVLENPTDAKVRVPEHTGHGTPERVETGTKPIGEGVQPKVPTSTAHDNNEKAAVTNVFTSPEGPLYGNPEKLPTSEEIKTPEQSTETQTPTSAKTNGEFAGQRQQTSQSQDELISEMIKDSNRKFPLTKVNARKILTDFAPEGFKPRNVAGSGGAGADVVFENAKGELFKIENKSITSIRSFDKEISSAVQRQASGGLIFIQVPEGTDVDNWLARFWGNRKNMINNPSPEDVLKLEKYRTTEVVIHDEKGKVLLPRQTVYNEEN
jgi:hypothetical protein